MVLPTVATIVPVYNRPELVLEALASIAAQTAPPARLIVVDDGSTDDTADRVQQWMDATDTPSQTHLIRQTNGCCGPARNRGVANAAGCDLLAFLDSDDLWPADYLQRMAAAMDASGAAVAASCDRMRTFAADIPDYFFCARVLEGQATTELFDGYCPNPSSTVVTAESFRKVGGFDARWRYFEDQDLFLRVSLLGPWAYVPGAPIVYRHGLNAVFDGPLNLTDELDNAAGAEMQASMLEEFVHQHGGREFVDPSRRRGCLAKLWHRAGKQRLRDGRPDDALRCFARALKANPRHHHSLTRWIRTHLSILFGSVRAQRNCQI